MRNSSVVFILTSPAVYRRDAGRARDRMGVNQNSYIENFAQQLGCQHRARWTSIENLPVLHQQNVIGKLSREVDVVRDHERGNLMLVATTANERQQRRLV